MQRNVVSMLVMLLLLGGAWGRVLTPDPSPAPGPSSHSGGGDAAQRKLGQQGNIVVNYVPQGCQGLEVAASGTAGYDAAGNAIIYGTVTLSNPNTFNMPIGSVEVQITSGSGGAPLYTTATCSSSSVPFNPQPYQLGFTTCSYQVSLASSSSATTGNWISVMATATIGVSGAQCPSPVTSIPPPPPPAPSNPCASLTVSAYAHRHFNLGFFFQGKRWISGAVVLQNPTSTDAVVLSVKVVLANSVGMPPLQVEAFCPRYVVPSGFGQMVCNWQVQLPSNGPARFANAWTAIQATTAVQQGTGGTSDSAQCKSQTFPITW